MELKFNNGKFRIMQIADIQDTQRTSDATVRFIREALKRAQPDLVVFTGDQIKGYGFNLMGGDNKKKLHTLKTAHPGVPIRSHTPVDRSLNHLNPKGCPHGGTLLILFLFYSSWNVFVEETGLFVFWSLPESKFC